DADSWLSADCLDTKECQDGVAGTKGGSLRVEYLVQQVPGNGASPSSLRSSSGPAPQGSKRAFTGPYPIQVICGAGDRHSGGRGGIGSAAGGGDGSRVRRNRFTGRSPRSR